jgi:hypothetical protein
MPYIINRTNGSKITVVQDGTANNTSLDIILLGKNYSGYGESVNENFVKLLENFSNVSPPRLPLSGQLWFDSANKILKLFDGTKFKSVGIVDYGRNKPVGMNAGDLHYNQADERLYAFNGSNWVLIGPFITAQTGTNGFDPQTILDTADILQTVLTAKVKSIPSLIISNEAFDLKESDDLYTVYNRVKRGITLPNTTADGISGFINPRTSERNGFLLWGTSASTLGFVETNQVTGSSRFIPASSYVKKTDLASIGNSLDITNDEGIVVGIQRVIKLHVTDSVVGNLSNIRSTSIKFNVTKPNNTTLTTVFSVDGQTGLRILPNTSQPVSIGDVGEGNQFSNIYASTVTATTVFDSNNRVLTSITATAGTGLSGGGTVQGPSGTVIFTNTGVLSVAGTENQITVNAQTAATTGTVVIGISPTLSISDITVQNIRAGTGGGNFYGIWQLTAGSKLQATYADIAERYAADNFYSPGTVLVIGGEKEVTTTDRHGNSSVAGIVSTNPAYTLNDTAGNDATHPYIALKGRVPCNVLGPVSKGDLLVTSTIPGFAERAHANDNPNAVLARSLENFDGHTGTIEVMVV